MRHWSWLSQPSLSQPDFSWPAVSHTLNLIGRSSVGMEHKEWDSTLKVATYFSDSPIRWRFTLCTSQIHQSGDVSHHVLLRFTNQVTFHTTYFSDTPIRWRFTPRTSQIHQSDDVSQTWFSQCHHHQPSLNELGVLSGQPLQCYFQISIWPSRQTDSVPLSHQGRPSVTTYMKHK